MKFGLLMSASLLFAMPAFACSPPSEAQLSDASSAVVEGTYVEASERGTGSVEVSSVKKGTTTGSYNIRWNPEAVDDGASCPDWRPTWRRQSGKFYLSENGDGTFTVLAQANLRRVRD